jgi:hypothetical protein
LLPVFGLLDWHANCITIHRRDDWGGLNGRQSTTAHPATFFLSGFSPIDAVTAF